MASGAGRSSRSGKASARPLARKLSVMVAAAVLPGVGSLAGLAGAGLVPWSVVAPLAGLSICAGGLGAWSAWRVGAQVDALAARLAAEAGVETQRTDTLALMVAAFAAAEQRMAAMARRGDPARRDDPETGLPNRQTVMRRGRDEITRARRNQHPLAVALMSVDIGPQADTPAERGAQERALRLIAEIAMQGLRAYDVVGRWERDVFIAVIPEAEVENAVTALERVRSMVLGARAIRSAETLPAVHAGVAVLQPDDATVAEIASRAQRALERARSGVGAAVQAAPGPRQRPVQLTSV